MMFSLNYYSGRRYKFEFLNPWTTSIKISIVTVNSIKKLKKNS